MKQVIRFSIIFDFVNICMRHQRASTQFDYLQSYWILTMTTHLHVCLSSAEHQVILPSTQN